MAYTILYSSRFKKSFKRVSTAKSFKRERFEEVLQLLSHNHVLPIQLRDHPLTGDMYGYRECHLAPDILLIYKIHEEILVITMIDIGNHAQLFR